MHTTDHRIRTLSFLVVAASLLWWFSAASTVRAASVDQQQTSGDHYAFGALTGSGTRSVCQSFVPTASELTSIDFALGTYGTYSTSRDLEVFLSSGGCKGASGSQTVLSHQLTPAEYDALSGGTSQPLTKHLLHWDFPTVEVAPGQTYYLGIRQLDACSGCLATLVASPSAYAPGSFRAGTWSDFYNESSSSDLWFATYATGLSLGPVTQYAADGTTPVAESATISSDLVIKAVTTSPDGSFAALEIELRPFGTPFTGAATHVSGLVASGTEASVTIPLPADGLYRYRLRAGDGSGDGSAWHEYGTAGNFDFEVSLTPFPGVVDQQQTAGSQYGFGTATNGGGVRTACQSFVPASSEITGVDLMLGTYGTYNTSHDVELFLTSGSCQGESGASAVATHALTQTEYDTLSGGTTLPLPARLFRWDTGVVAVTPGQTYYLGIRQTDACQNCLSTLLSIADRYAAGSYRYGYWSDAFADEAGSDLWFRTYGPEVPTGPMPIKVAVILADLADVQHESGPITVRPCKLSETPVREYANGHSREYYEDLIYCVKDYYDENSYGSIGFEFTMVGDGAWQSELDSTKTESWYAQQSTRSLVDDVMALSGVSENSFDVVIVVHAGDSRENEDQILKIRTAMAIPPPSPESARVVVAESDPLGAWVHELGHAVGMLVTMDGTAIPDLYDMGSVGKWDVMANGDKNGGFSDISILPGDGTNPVGLSSYTKEFLGLLNEDIRPRSQYGTHWIDSLDTSGFGDSIFRYNLIDDATTSTSQYYILEARNRDLRTWDSSLPGMANPRNLVLYYVDTKNLPEYGYYEDGYGRRLMWNQFRKLTIPGNSTSSPIVFNTGILSTALLPAEARTYFDFDHMVKFSATSERFVDNDTKYQIQASIQPINPDSFADGFAGVVLRPLESLQRFLESDLPSLEYGGRLNPVTGEPEISPGIIPYQPTLQDFLTAVILRLLIVLGSVLAISVVLWLLHKYGVPHLLPPARYEKVLRIYNKSRHVFFVLLSLTLIAVIALYAIDTYLRVTDPAGHRKPWPLKGYLNASVVEVAQPDLDLHVYCSDGRHVGMNYSTGVFENQVADAIVSGDEPGSHEWIYVPATPENASCIHSVSAHDNQLFLDANPDLASVLGSATDSYSIYARYIDPASGIFTSATLSEQVIEPGEVILHAATGTSDISILPGVPDAEPPVTTASATGTLGLDGTTYVSDVTVTLASNDADSGVLSTRYSLDGGLTYVPYPGQIMLTVEGERTVAFFSTDIAGNAESPKTITVRIDRLAPETTIDAAPSDPSSSTSASFGFSSPDATALFECSLDAVPFMPCASPLVLVSLATGAHDFSVRAIDSAGNVDSTPAMHDWTVAPPGPAPASLHVTFQRHTVQNGTQPGSTKAPIADAAVKAFSKTSGTCASQIGFNPHEYGTILDTCAADVQGMTDADGATTLSLAPGDYLTLARDPQTAVVAGVSSGTLAPGASDDEFLQVIVRADGTSVPAKTTKRTGSLLYVIEPEYIEWNQTQELYPFVFDAPDGDWGLTVTVTPPEGFTVDHDSLTTEVNSDYKALQFTLTDIGSCWECGAAVELTIRHKGKVERLLRNIPSSMTEDFAGKKGLNPADLKAKGVVVSGKGER
ncbi:MAG: hypothetical protein AAB554_03200 [Patescibacteria group bacterium]